jgi:hypothetical protein
MAHNGNILIQIANGNRSEKSTESWVLLDAGCMNRVQNVRSTPDSSHPTTPSPITEQQAS